MNVSKWFNLYSFDVMGDLAFGASYGCLESGEMHWAIKLLNDGMDMLGVQLPNWLFRLLIAIALRWGLNPNDLKLITAIFVFAALVLPGFIGGLNRKKTVTA